MSSQYKVTIAALSLTILSTAVRASDWYVSADASSYAYFATTFGGNGVNSAIDAECNGTASNCTAADGFMGRSDPTNPIAQAVTSARGYLDYNYGGPIVTAADASASADLTRGELKLYQSASAGGDLTSAGADTSFRDNLHFDLSSYSSPVAITVDLRVDGLFQGFSQPRFAFDLGDSIDDLNTGIVGWADTNPVAPETTATAFFIDFGGGTGRSGDWSIYGPDRFRGTFLLDPAHPDVHVAMFLSAGGGSGTYTAFNHTAALSLILPNGLSYTSDSGQFLSGVPSSAVPEPGSWTLIFVGLGVVGAGLRTRRLITAAN